MVAGRRWARGECVACGYSRAGLEGRDLCPECGALPPVAPPESNAAWVRRHLATMQARHDALEARDFEAWLRVRRRMERRPRLVAGVAWLVSIGAIAIVAATARWHSERTGRMGMGWGGGEEGWGIETACFIGVCFNVLAAGACVIALLAERERADWLIAIVLAWCILVGGGCALLLAAVVSGVGIGG